MNNNVVGMILAAGFGSRLQKLSQLRPKPLMELFGKAILFHQIKMLEQAGIKDIFINLHYHHKQLIAAVHSWSLKSHIHFSFEKDILGTAGGIRQVIKLFQLNNQAMIVLHGDMICDFDLKEIISPHAFCNLLIAQNKQTDGYRGAVSIDDNCRIS
ncbi:MAG: NTP transferase domain-containing protein, partial [Myxococcales bacterium]|nr:NTP transferase domain-containing protein [Myxococcales bacterium]